MRQIEIPVNIEYLRTLKDIEELRSIIIQANSSQVNKKDSKAPSLIRKDEEAERNIPLLNFTKKEEAIRNIETQNMFKELGVEII